MDYDIYREELATKYPAYGHALWEPGPGGRYTSVEIGDVGFIRQGYFHRFFNILLPEDHQSHKDGVPQHHEPLKLEMTSPTNTGTLPHNYFRSIGVLDKSEEHRQRAREPDEAAQVSFLCSGRRGAILSLPMAAQRKDTTARDAFAKCITKHIDEWFAFARKFGLGISREDIILVTGCHLARTWATIAFQERGEQVAFGVQVSGVADVTWQFTPEGAQGVAYNLGPSGQNLPENQCIFIRGFRVKRILMILPKPRAAAGPAQLPDEDDPDPDAQLGSTPNETCYQDPLRTVLEYIATAAPECDMALVHDDDLRYINTASLESLRPDTIINYLRKSAPKIWQLSCGGSHKDISLTSHGGKGESKSKAPSQMKVAALSEFNMVHELEPVIEERVASPSTSHRGHRKIPPSYSWNVNPTAFKNAVGKLLPSSQKKQGDNQQKQARDFVLSEVPSAVTENDLKVTEDEITSARKMKVELNNKSGIQKSPHAHEYYKPVSDATDSAFDHFQFQPQAGTSSEVEDIYRTARSLYRCQLSCKDAFPSPLTQDKWVVDTWNEAHFRTGAHPNSLVRQDEEIKCDSMRFLTDIKTKIKHVVQYSFGFNTSKASDSISHNASLAQALLAKTSFIFREIDFMGRPRYPYRHPIIQKVINVAWFDDRNDLGIVFHEYFNPIPFEAIALALTVIECCICEWLNGIYKESAWTEKHYITNYFAHLNSLHDLDAHGANREGRDILAQIRDDLLKNARIHAGANYELQTSTGKLSWNTLETVIRDDNLVCDHTTRTEERRLSIDTIKAALQDDPPKYS